MIAILIISTLACLAIWMAARAGAQSTRYWVNDGQILYEEDDDDDEDDDES